MKLKIIDSTPKSDVLVLALYKKQALSAAARKALGKTLAQAVTARIKAKDFEGEAGQSLTLYLSDGPVNRLVLLGRGESDKQMPTATEHLGGRMAGVAKAAKAKSMTIIADPQDVEALAYGLVLGNYEFSRYKKTDKKAPKLGSVNFMTRASKASRAALKRAMNFESASTLVRDLVNTPAGDMNPKHMESAARKVAKKYDMKLTVLDHKKLEKMGAGLILGVGRGAEVPPRILILEYKHKAKGNRPNLALIGKGITFDTGGLNLKPTNYIETMKQDMAGAATVLGAMQAIAEAKLKGYFLGVLCCAENAISDKARRPGDVDTAFNGKTVEITNTDAEGRLAMGDGLAYTEKHYKPKAMVDMATLTGGVSVALGYHIAGLVGTDQKLIDAILEAGRSSGERLWQLPLDADFIKATKGKFTDLINSTNGVRASCTMGGAFLRNFVKDTPWAHIDIGGTAWAEKPSSTTKYGSTGMGLRTFMALAEQYAD